jgi:hypothetical protein
MAYDFSRNLKEGFLGQRTSTPDGASVLARDAGKDAPVGILRPVQDQKRREEGEMINYYDEKGNVMEGTLSDEASALATSFVTPHRGGKELNSSHLRPVLWRFQES